MAVNKLKAKLITKSEGYSCLCWLVGEGVGVKEGDGVVIIDCKKLKAKLRYKQEVCLMLGWRKGGLLEGEVHQNKTKI
jgi:hypothetical protein